MHEHGVYQGLSIKLDLIHFWYSPAYVDRIGP